MSPGAQASRPARSRVVSSALIDCGRSARQLIQQRRQFVAQLAPIDNHVNGTVIKTRAEALDIEVVVGDPNELVGSVEAFGLLLQYPGTYGEVHDIAPLIERAHAAQTLVTVAADTQELEKAHRIRPLGLRRRLCTVAPIGPCIVR